MLSSNQDIFDQEAPIYNEGLRLAGYNEQIQYIPPQMKIGIEESVNVMLFTSAHRGMTH